jgi:hypothetical protein
VKNDSALTEALDAALRSAREVRERTHVALDLLAPKIIDSATAGYAIMSLVDIFVEICGAYALLHEMMKPCLEISGVDLQALVTAAMGQKRSGSRPTPSVAARAFGHVLRELRKSGSLTSNELAARASLDIHRYEEIDGGLSEPNLVELSRIGVALGLRPSELVGRFESVSLVPRAIDTETATR